MTIIECKAFNTGYTIGKSDTRQVIAISKRITSDGCHTIWNDDARQTKTTSESTASNAFNTIRNSDVFQRRALIKSTASNAFNTIRNSDTRQVITAIERLTSDTSHFIFLHDIRYSNSSSCPVIVIHLTFFVILTCYSKSHCHPFYSSGI